MKKLFTFMAAALFTLTAAANGEVTDGWLMVEDFEGSPTITTYNYLNGTPSGTASVIDNATRGKVASFVGGNYNTVIEFDVTLPDGKTLNNYSQIAFDLYRNAGDSNNKKMLVQADNFRIHMDEGDDNYPEQAPAETWTEKSYSIDLTNTVGNSFKLRIGILSDAANYLIDNVRLKVINEEDMPGESQNGTVTDGWLMAEDFEGYLMGAKLTVYPIQYDAKGNADVAKAPTDDRGRSAHFMATDWNNIIEVPITLPQGKVLSNYSDISFDLYICDGSNTNRDIYIYANDETILAQSGYPNQGNTGEWLAKEFSIPEGLAAGNTFNLRIGMNTDAGAEYYIDNVRLKESSEPLEPGTSHNGEIIDGKLMVEDFNYLSDIRMYNYLGYSPQGTLGYSWDPTDSSNLVASFEGGDYNTVIELDVTLPDGKTLSDYTQISFDVYARSTEGADNQNKNMLVWADEFVIHQDDDYSFKSTEDTWVEHSYAIPTEGNTIGNAFKLRLGILTNAADYLLDNVMLTPSTSSGITDVTAEGTAIVVGNGCVTITADDETAVAIYTAEGQLVARETVDGSTTISLARGLYIVNAGTQVRKVLVK